VNISDNLGYLHIPFYLICKAKGPETFRKCQPGDPMLYMCLRQTLRRPSVMQATASSFHGSAPDFKSIIACGAPPLAEHEAWYEKRKPAVSVRLEVLKVSAYLAGRRGGLCISSASWDIMS
jgi:hypothetical protein